MKDFLNYKGYIANLSRADLKELFKELEHYKMKYRYNLNIPENISFGVEIEFQNALLIDIDKEMSKDSAYKYWWLHKDDSVSNVIDDIVVGGEVSTDILYDSKDNWENLYNLFNILILANAEATDKTSFHIHVGAQIFKKDLIYAKRFIKLWCVFEHIIYRFGYGYTDIARPAINIFAPPIAPLYKKLYQNNKYYFDELESTSELDFGKKRAVNFRNYHYLYDDLEVNNTIEIRTPNGTMNSVMAQNNVNFFIKLMNYVSSEEYDEELIDNMFSRFKVKSLKDYSDLDINNAVYLCDLIFNESFDKINFLSQYIKKDDYMYLR